MRSEPLNPDSDRRGGIDVTPGELRALSDARRQENLGGIVSNEIILTELASFLEAGFASGGDSVLDVGAGTRPYAPLYERYFARSVSTDVSHSQHDVSGVSLYAPADELPFEAASFDCVICTEVLEHCPDPWAAAAEIARVLKPKGWAFITTPFLRPIHEPPHDYHRFTSWGLHELARRSGLEVRSLTPRGDYTAVVLLGALMPVSRAWQALSRVTRLPLYRPGNPLVWATVIAPQRAYLRLWRLLRERQGGAARRLYDKLTYYTLGYVMVVQRSSERAARG